MNNVKKIFILFGLLALLSDFCYSAALDDNAILSLAVNNNRIASLYVENNFHNFEKMIYKNFVNENNKKAKDYYFKILYENYSELIKGYIEENIYTTSKICQRKTFADYFAHVKSNLDQDIFTKLAIDDSGDQIHDFDYFLAACFQGKNFDLKWIDKEKERIIAKKIEGYNVIYKKRLNVYTNELTYAEKNNDLDAIKIIKNNITILSPEFDKMKENAVQKINNDFELVYYLLNVNRYWTDIDDCNSFDDVKIKKYFYVLKTYPDKRSIPFLEKIISVDNNKKFNLGYILDDAMYCLLGLNYKPLALKKNTDIKKWQSFFQNNDIDYETVKKYIEIGNQELMEKLINYNNPLTNK